MTITYKKQDLFTLHGHRIIAHVVNDARRWGRGFTASIDKACKRNGWGVDDVGREYFRWWDAHAGFLQSEMVGDIQRVQVASDITVVNMCAMRGVYHSRNNPLPLDYNALARCLQKLGKLARDFESVSIHMPRIGAGLARGEWSRIEPLINKNLKELEVIIYDFNP